MPTKPTGRPPGNPAWKKGVSGNPSGMPAGHAEFKALARSYTPQAVAALVSALKDSKLKVQAAQALLDRGWGKPAQPIAGADGESPVEHVIRWLNSHEAAALTQTPTTTETPPPSDDASST